jgi:hypothetical protein
LHFSFFILHFDFLLLRRTRLSSIGRERLPHIGLDTMMTQARAKAAEKP